MLRAGLWLLGAVPVLWAGLGAHPHGLTPIEVAFAKDTLDAGDLGYGLLLASWGTGMVLGSLVFAGLRRHDGADVQCSRCLLATPGLRGNECAHAR